MTRLQLPWPAALETTDADKSYALAPFAWEDFEQLLARWGDDAPYRLSYLDGVLYLMAPSRWHEDRKTRVGSLLELYFLARSIEYFPTGSTTFKNAYQKVGLEPDESYCLFTDKAIPDLAIEIIVASGGVQRLALYQRLGVAEVWLYRRGGLQIYGLNPQLSSEPPSFGYTRQDKSLLLPELDVALLLTCLETESALTGLQRWQAALGAGKED
ncbi:MAG: Uma2 family endonuclease [Cyanobacteria bacterium RI_101]|nr:Uma2 family endonuclease [Cyanobacteria bacterium RI_101]